MTTPHSDSIEAPTAAAKPAGRWEDFIDIFYAPSSVYERRKDQSPWPTIWILTIVIVLVMVLMFNGLASVYENEMRAAMAKAMAKSPQMTQDMVNTSVKWSLFGRRWGGIFFPLGVLIGALIVWLVGKLVSAKESYGGALVIVTYSAILGVAQQLVVSAQGLVMDVSNLTSPDQLSLSAARFVDKATMSPVLYSILKQLDLFGIWGLIVTAIGIHVIGRTTKNQAIAYAVIWWVGSTLIVIGFAMRTAAAG